ncbi:hypothetical protein Ahy_A10g046778 [Arachis hypogaea]|uniref:Uncharacterized protein n=1 Tax=Arachis hypogaea TaxID=3818 RepID=A0A445B0I3_ARAHY|nr:hypothetical protein Ahy_A10g046778 [Arachis hypogaea]
MVELRGVAKAGELINFEACMEIMDLLYEKEETSLLCTYSCPPHSLAASILFVGVENNAVHGFGDDLTNMGLPKSPNARCDICNDSPSTQIGVSNSSMGRLPASFSFSYRAITNAFYRCHYCLKKQCATPIN